MPPNPTGPWVVAENSIRIFEEAQRQAEIRYAGILESFVQGDKPAIDTLEAFIQVQNRRLDVNFARVELQNAALELANFRWTPDGVPVVEVTPGTPEPAPIAASYPPIASSEAANLVQTALQSHPDLLAYEAKLSLLNVERRLKLEKRKPVLDLGYQLLGNGWQFFSTPGLEGPGVFVNDVKWSLRFSYPIRTERRAATGKSRRSKLPKPTLHSSKNALKSEQGVIF